MEMCQHGKTNMSIHIMSEYCKKIWPNLAPVLRIWRKEYLSGESGGERKKFIALTLGSNINLPWRCTW